MKKIELTRKQKMLTSVIGAVLAVVLILAVIAVSVNSCSDKKVFVERDVVSVTVDSGVSVTLKLNSEFAVTEASALSEADKGIVQNLAGKVPFTVSFEQLINKLNAEGKLEGTEDEVILVTIESIKQEDYEKALEIINNILADKEYKTKVITLYIRARETKIESFAEKNGISYGKAYFCNKIAKESSSLKADELASKTIEEIYRLSTEDKSESHVSSVVSDLNSSQTELVIPEEESKPSSSQKEESSGASSGESSGSSSSDKETSSNESSSEDTTTSGDETSSDDTTTSDEETSSTPSESKPEEDDGDESSSSAQSYASESSGGGWISGWY